MQVKTFNPNLIATFINFLYPSNCPICLKKTDNIIYSPFCISCWSNIKRYTGPSCRVCTIPIISADAVICSNCLKKQPFYSKAICFGIYDDIFSNVISHFKFYGIRRLHKPLGRLLLEITPKEIDAVIPVPLSITRLRERGFNQSLLLARIISKSVGKPLLINHLIKHKETLPQIGLSAKEREANIKNAFKVTKGLKGLRLLLIDDVMTTGATLNECSRVLLNAGAQEVIALTLARASR